MIWEVCERDVLIPLLLLRFQMLVSKKSLNLEENPWSLSLSEKSNYAGVVGLSLRLYHWQKLQLEEISKMQKMWLQWVPQMGLIDKYELNVLKRSWNKWKYLCCSTFNFIE
jgi:hypothetical protein